MTADTENAQTGWRLLDDVVRAASTPHHSNPWFRDASGSTVFEPDFATLKKLLAVPSALDSKSQTGLPALSIDIWVAFELRRAGFDPDSVWPRENSPRILPTPISQLLRSLPIPERRKIQARLDSGANTNGAVAANARILGKHYFKQVDVVLSAWDTGPEILISTKRMDKSFNRNAANRVEESYGDAKNLRQRHPMAAMGFVYALNAEAFRTKPDKAAWLVDLLTKLGRESDAYDAVLLIAPDYGNAPEPSLSDDEDGNALRDAGLDEDEAANPSTDMPATPDVVKGISIEDLPDIGLLRDEIPLELSAGRFFSTITRLTLDRTPVTQHKEARRRFAEPRTPL